MSVGEVGVPLPQAPAPDPVDVDRVRLVDAATVARAPLSPAELRP